MRPLRGSLLMLLVGVLLLLFFAWGFLTHRNKIFPFPLLKSLKREARTNVEARIVSNVKHLTSLGYIQGTYDPDFRKKGILLNINDQTSPGINFYHSRGKSEANLIDMEGNTIYKWSYPSEKWQHVELLPSGDIIASIKDEKLLKIDKSSNLIWSYKARFHHDHFVWENGDIYALTRKAIFIPEIHPVNKTLVDYITVLSDSGKLVQEISILELIQASAYAYILPSVAHIDFKSHLDLDILHTNHIELLDGLLQDVSPIYARGNVLISIRNINMTMILDIKNKEIVWAWGPTNLIFPHHTTLLRNGNILLFNNGIEKSEVLEINPLDFQIKWHYSDDGFFSEFRGSNQRLPNGNTLITESDKGYVFEVTPDNRTVWKFANPNVDENGIRMAIWRMTRFQKSQLPFLSDF